MKELVILQNEQPITTSLKVAEVFEKRHDNVIQAIEKAKITLLNFKDSEKAFKKDYSVISMCKQRFLTE